VPAAGVLTAGTAGLPLSPWVLRLPRHFSARRVQRVARPPRRSPIEGQFGLGEALGLVGCNPLPALPSTQQTPGPGIQRGIAEPVPSCCPAPCSALAASECHVPAVPSVPVPSGGSDPTKLSPFHCLRSVFPGLRALPCGSGTLLPEGITARLGWAPGGW